MSDLSKRLMKLYPGGMVRIIRLPKEDCFDSRFETPSLIFFYNKANHHKEVSDILDLHKLIESGEVAIYSKTENRTLPEIKREIEDNAFERRCLYYLPSGECFANIKIMCKTPDFI